MTKILSIFAVTGALLQGHSQDALRLQGGQVETNGDFQLTLGTPTASFITVERSTNAARWDPLSTLDSAKTNRYRDSSALYHSSAIFRLLKVDGTNVFTGDHLVTAEGNVIFHPVDHASFVMQWKGLTIYNDPVGSAALYSSFPRADLILVSHEHGDHFNATTLAALRRTEGANTIIIAPAAVFSALPTSLKTNTTVLLNGDSTNVLGIQIDAVPAYNSNHPKGRGNGYLVGIGGKRIYISGDTGDIAETMSLRDIDVAFLCMNVPFTMSTTQAAALVRRFAPRAVYPYHFKNQDGSFPNLNSFRSMAGATNGVEVRIRKWY